MPEVLSFLRVDDESRSGTVRDFGPHLLDKLIVVTKFGRDFLDPEEFLEVDRRTRGEYLRILGDAILTRRSAAFWRYHRDGLATVGLPIGWRQLWRPVLTELADRVFNPKKTLGRFLRP